jgi:hypothetical protein
MKKIVRISESEINNIVKTVLSEQRYDIPKDVKMVYNKYLMSPNIEDYIFEDVWEDVQSMWENNEFQDAEEIIETLAHSFTFMAATMYIYGEGFDDDYELEDEMSKKLLQYYDNEQIIRKVLENINHPKKEEVFAFIDKVKGITPDSIKLAKRRRGIILSGDDLYKYIYDNYIEPEMAQRNMNDFIDEFAYYDNIIDWGIQEYLAAEEPDLESEEYDEKFDELGNAIKDYWTPF